MGERKDTIYVNKPEEQCQAQREEAVKEALIMTGSHCECQGPPHHLRIFVLGQAKPSPVVFHGEGGKRGTKSPALARKEEVI